MKILSIKETQEKLGGAARSTLWRWSLSGEFVKARQLGRGRVGFLESEVDEWIKTRPVTGSAKAAK